MEKLSRRHGRSTRFLIVAVFCLVHSVAYSAAVLVKDGRLVHSSGSVSSQTSLQSFTVEERSPGNFGAFNFSINETRSAGTNQATSSASMTSNITDTLFSASASAGESLTANEPPGSGFSFPSTSGRALFEAMFQVLTPMSFDLTGNLSFTQAAGFPRGGASLNLSNGSFGRGGTFNISLGNGSASNSFSQAVQLSGLLPPDTYTLRVQASVGASGISVGRPQASTAAFDFNFLLGIPGGASVVPVPAAVWLFGSAIGLLGWLGRRGSRS